MKYKKRIYVRVSEEVYDMLLQNSRDSKNTSDYLRNVIKRDFANKIEDCDVADFKNMERQLIGLGNNVNQIAHHLNMALYTTEDAVKLRQCMSEISELRKEIRILKNKIG